MLEDYCRSRAERAVWEQNMLAPLLEEAAARFTKDRYCYLYARASLRFMASFGGWLQEKRIPIERVTEDHVDSFLDDFIGRPTEASFHRRRQVRAGVHFVLSLIREKCPMPVVRGPAQEKTRRFVAYLRRDRGLAECTIDQHGRDLEEFLISCFGQGEVHPAELTAARLLAYVAGSPGAQSNFRRRRVCTTLRCYFRFLRLQGVSVSHLGAAIPRIAVPRKALSPKVVTVAQVEQLLRSFDRSQAKGRRNHAAVLCMCDLGMRLGDVARLSLDDIDWREGSVKVANHKAGQPYRLPLPKRVGQALADYLATGRPSSSQRQVFLCHSHPYGSPVTAGALKAVVRAAWKRCGRQERPLGTHILRHSAATRMKQKGIPLKTIADVLGHRSLRTTALYAQVDLPALRKVAQPWPEGQP